MAAAARRERPILFSGPMALAVREGRKTQTRRLMRPGPPVGYRLAEAPCSRGPGRRPWSWDAPGPFGTSLPAFQARCPYGEPGDRLWVREAYGRGYLDDREAAEAEEAGEGRPLFYRADWPDRGVQPSLDGGWFPSILMPRRACRTVVEVVSRRPEVLGDLSRRDAVREGVGGEGEVWRVPGLEGPGFDDPVFAFAAAWESIHGPGAWGRDRDRWVWVVEFKLVEAL